MFSQLFGDCLKSSLFYYLNLPKFLIASIILLSWSESSLSFNYDIKRVFLELINNLFEFLNGKEYHSQKNKKMLHEIYNFSGPIFLI